MTAVVQATLESLVGVVPGTLLVGDGTVKVRRIVADSRSVSPADLFVALADDPAKASVHAQDAVARGASAVVARVHLHLPVPVLVCANAGRFLSLVAERFEGAPTSRLVCIGITGTNGKTTTTRLVEQALLALGQRPALIGTGVMRAPGLELPSVFTTPFGDAISRFARDAADAGATHLVMEVSSHALEQGRADGVAFRIAAFTNLTRDHLDYHGTMEAYGAAKTRFFTELAPARSVIHVGDAFGRELAARANGQVMRVAVQAEADIVASSVRYSVDGLEADVSTPLGQARVTSPLVGRHNLENLLVALGCLLQADVPLHDAVAALSTATGAEGRLERVEHPHIGVFVDYAHTPDAIERVLAALRPSTTGRLLIVFGCGGDRDRGKRPAMAAAAVRGADLLLVTSDNPRTEDAQSILDEIVAGLDRDACPAVGAAELATASRGHHVVLDRRAAIELALTSARPGDTVLIAGKGHEDYQIVGTTKHPFDDRVEARRALALRQEAV